MESSVVGAKLPPLDDSILIPKRQKEIAEAAQKMTELQTKQSIKKQIDDETSANGGKPLSPRRILEIHAGAGQTDAAKDLLSDENKGQTEEQLTSRSLKGDPEAQKILDAMQRRKIDIAKNTKAATVNIQPQGSGAMTQDAVELAGIQWATTGQMPALGMGNGAMRAKIMNSGAAYLKKQGVDPTTVPAVQAEFKATKEAYTQQKKGVEGIAGFVGGMIKNADYATSLSNKYYRTSLPPVNQILNAIKTKTGDPQIVQFSNAIYAAALEYAKIRTAGTQVSSAELSIQAQQKAEELVNTAQTPKQLDAAFQAMKVDAKNIESARRENLKLLENELKKNKGFTGLDIIDKPTTSGATWEELKKKKKW